MSQSPRAYVENALETALAQYAEVMGEAFSLVVSARTAADDAFWAMVSKTANGIEIEISTGAIKAIERLWRDGLSSGNVLQDSKDEPITDDTAALTHVSLVWLIFHEMQHAELGHFELLGRTVIGETAAGQQLALVERDSESPRNLTSLNVPAEHLDKVEPCLEMQADHDAMELLLDAYSTDAWDELRVRATCIAAVMILIERAEPEAGVTHSTHPMAATRIFQLLGHLSEIPMIETKLTELEPSLGIAAITPSKQELRAFNKEVESSEFGDAVAMAAIGGAPKIAGDLGEPDVFFADINLAAQSPQSGHGKLQTLGARQWADLVKINQKLLGEAAQS